MYQSTGLMYPYFLTYSRSLQSHENLFKLNGSIDMLLGTLNICGIKVYLETRLETLLKITFLVQWKPVLVCCWFSWFPAIVYTTVTIRQINCLLKNYYTIFYTSGMKRLKTASLDWSVIIYNSANILSIGWPCLIFTNHTSLPTVSITLWKIAEKCLHLTNFYLTVGQLQF